MTEKELQDLLTSYSQLRKYGYTNVILKMYDDAIKAGINGVDLIHFMCKYPDMDEDQFSEIIEGLRYKLEISEIEIYADTKFESRQMRQIRRALQSLRYGKLSLNTLPHIMEYAKPEINWRTMMKEFHLDRTYNIVYVNGGNQND